MTPPRALFSPEALAQLNELENFLLEHASTGGRLWRPLTPSSA